MCSDRPAVEIVRSKQGYFTLYMSGVFQGNYDTYLEAAREADRILFPEERLVNSV